jgi:fibronectin type 3 domain-containing protein
VYFEKGNDPVRNLAGTVTGTSYIHEGLDAGIVYHYYVSAVNSDGEGAFSLHTFAKTLTAGPAIVTATGLSANSIRVAWSAAAGAAGYKIHSAASLSGDKSVVGTTITETTYTHTGLQAGTSYFYFVTAVLSDGESAYSPGASAITVPAAPVGVTAAAQSANSISVSWTAATGAASYKVYYAASAGGEKTLVGTVTSGTSYTHTGLSASTAYYYFITAVNASGESDFSQYTENAAAVTKAPAPTGVTATALSATSIQVSWNAVSGAASYKIYSAASSTAAKTQAGTSTETAYTHSGLQAGTTCYYFVVAVVGASESDYSAAVSIITYPNAPTGVAATAASANSISVSWTAATGAASYKVYYAASAGGEKTLAGTVTSGTSYTHTGLSASTAYYYFITAVNASGESGFSQYTENAAAVTKAPAPSGVTATALSATSIQVSWNAVSGAASYKIYSAASSSGTKNLLATVASGTSYTHSGLSSATDYYYWITAVNNDGESAFSEWASARVLTLPSVPTGVNAAALSTGSVSVSWNAVAGAASYKVYSASSSSGTKNLIATVTDAAYTHTGLTADTYYYYFVTAVNGVGESGYSAYVSAKTGTIPAPTGVTVTAQSATSVMVSWNSVSEATSYKIYWSYRLPSWSYSETVLAQTTTGTSWLHTGVQASTTHYYYVVAVNASGESGRSTEMSVTTPALPPGPTGVTAAAVSKTSTSIKVSWAAMSGASSYKVYYATSPGGEKLPAGTSTSASYTHSGLPANQTYYYWVTAVASGVESAWSASYGEWLLVPAPANVTYTITSLNSITLQWDACGGAYAYDVYYISSAMSSSKSLATLQTSYLFGGLASGLTYRFAVVALYEDGYYDNESDLSDFVQFTW